MSSDFEQFTQAIARDSAARVSAPVAFENTRVTVLGGGDDGRLLAAVCLAENAEVTLFSAYGAELDALRAAGGITLRGEGPIGTFQVDQSAVPAIQTTAELDRAVVDADIIFLTGPVHKQRTYAMVLADHLKDGQVVVITPSRSFAALETAWLLRTGGCTADVTLVEWQQLPFWLLNDAASPLHLSSCSATLAATLPAGRVNEVARLTTLFPTLSLTQSVMDNSFADASGCVESVALLLGGAVVTQNGPDLPPGAQPLADNYTFNSLINNEHSQSVLTQLLDERRQVATRFGVRNLPDNAQWILDHSGLPKGIGSRAVPDTSHAQHLLRCAVTGSLVPLQSAARLAGVATPVTDAMTTLASSMLNADLRSAGRQLPSMGVAGDSLDDARTQLHALAQGDR